MDVAKIDDWLFPNELPVGEELIKKYQLVHVYFPL
jgi:hypothetical protein